jgi:hypothetical protein
MPDGKTKSDGTLARYAREIRRVAADAHFSLTEATAYDINRLMDAYLNGNINRIKDEGLANGTVTNRVPSDGSTCITTISVSTARRSTSQSETSHLSMSGICSPLKRYMTYGTKPNGADPETLA